MKFTSINLLEELAKPELADLLNAFHERAFTRQHMIFAPTFDDDQDGNAVSPSHARNGGAKAGNFVFIVRSGRVRVYLSYAEKEFTIAVLRPGDVFVSHANAFVQALEDCRILLTDTATFNARMMAVPQFSMAVVRVLGGMLKNTFSIIDGLALRDATVRLARFLMDNATGAQGERIVHLNISGELLAQTLGASRQTISTLITDLARAGILHKERRGVYRILAEDRLRELAV